MNRDNTQVRSATAADIPVILSLLGKKAEFDRATGGFTGELETTAARIEASLFGDPAFARALIADDGETQRGFALFYFRYSSFIGRPSLWLDDLYVEETARSRGVGALLVARLTEIAAGHDCTHLSWTASLSNPRGIAFYQRLGATIVGRDEVRVTFRLAISPRHPD